MKRDARHEVPNTTRPLRRRSRKLRSTNLSPRAAEGTTSSATRRSAARATHPDLGRSRTTASTRPLHASGTCSMSRSSTASVGTVRSVHRTRNELGLEGHRSDEPARGHHRRAAGAIVPDVPFDLPNSVRALDPRSRSARPSGSTTVDPTTSRRRDQRARELRLEYVWHCTCSGPQRRT